MKNFLKRLIVKVVAKDIMKNGKIAFALKTYMLRQSASSRQTGWPIMILPL